MSFGIAVGDFIAVSKLVSDIVSSLQSVGSARSEYQELIRELEALSTALRHLDRLEHTPVTAANVASVKYAALSCRHPLEEFLAKVQKFEKDLGPRRMSSKWQATTSKLKWSFGQKDNVKRLQTYLDVHIGTINILLAEHGLELMNLAEKTTRAHSSQVRDQLDATQGYLVKLKKSASAQALALRNVQFVLGDLHRAILGEFKTSWGHFGRLISSVINTVVLEICNALTVVDTRWTLFQAPLVVEDALGFKFPVPSEYDFDKLDTIIRQRFKTGFASREVAAGNYELCKANDRSFTLSELSRLLPGTSIIMAIVVVAQGPHDMRCPMPHCKSRQALPWLNGGYTWYYPHIRAPEQTPLTVTISATCGIWFDETKKQRSPLDDLAEIAQGPEASSDTQGGAQSADKLKRKTITS
ncbi:hypothetical protein E8E12_007860 [Didymella heteroderae]|uniref:Fungal N-terminal domain-containing protein n=1 Tax=Didymella heteroderae TaxID=1769908 RepID=A0A9P4WTI9_9PLEO|nr:hypothetical protein E8E12_007860 [Didymella heteroderae]